MRLVAQDVWSDATTDIPDDGQCAALPTQLTQKRRDEVTTV